MADIITTASTSTVKTDSKPVSDVTFRNGEIHMLLPFHVLGNPGKRASVVYRPNGEVVTDMWDGQWRIITDTSVIAKAYEVRKSGGYQGTTSSPFWADLQKMDPNKVSSSTPAPSFTGSDPFHTTVEKDKVNIVELVKKWMDFFSEFNFFPQVRFINSIVRQPDAEGVRQYVLGYFRLTNNSFANEVAEKVKSPEFQKLAETTASVTTDKVINERFDIMFGAPGTGKTTIAIMENPDAEVEICHASMTPDELFRGFDFEDGKPIFRPCAVKKAMEEGKAVILDEINLLNEDCRRALQAITDAKETITINNEEIHIKKGFRVIGTMNLTVGDMVCPLPEPLVDRAYRIREFQMSAKDVAALAI